MKKIITTIIGVLLVIGIIFGIFWFFFNVGTRSEVDVKETKQRETKQIETQQIENETQDDVVIVNREELQKKNEEQRQKEFERYELLVETFTELCTKNGKWDNLPLSDNLKEKYNSKTGILTNLDYDIVSQCSVDTESKKAIIILYKNYNKNNELEYRTELKYKENKEGQIDEIVNIETEKTNGEYSIREEQDPENIDKVMPILEDTVAIIVREMAMSSDGWENFAVSQDLIKKYASKKGLLNKNDIVDIYIKNNDFKNKVVELEVLLDNRTTEDYKIKWKINSSKELEDITVEKETVDISKIETYAKPVLKNKKDIAKEESVEE